jgi:hypothetical protein
VDWNWGDPNGHIYSLWFQDTEHTLFYPILMWNRIKLASLEIDRRGDKVSFHRWLYRVGTRVSIRFNLLNSWTQCYQVRLSSLDDCAPGGPPGPQWKACRAARGNGSLGRAEVRLGFSPMLIRNGNLFLIFKPFSPIHKSFWISNQIWIWMIPMRLIKYKSTQSSQSKICGGMSTTNIII